MAEQQAERKSESSIAGAKIVLIGTITAAIIGAVATIVAALLSHRDSGPTFPVGSRVLDKSALEGETGVKKILVDNYGMRADEIRGLTCPSDQEVKAGNKFTCTFTLSGDHPGQQVVDIVVLDDNGQYQVGKPHDR